MINIALSHKLGLLLIVALLTGCSADQRSTGGITLPQQFRLPANNSFTFLERRSGRIAVASADGNIIVTDQTGESPLQITRDAGAGVLRDRSGIAEQRYSLPIWSPDGTQLAVLETHARYPLTFTKSVDNVNRALAQTAPGATVSEETIGGAVTRELTETGTFDEQPSRITFEYGGQVVRSSLYTVVPNGKSALKEVLYQDESVIEFADWSPSGDQLGVITRSPGDGRKLTLLNNDGSNPVEVTSGENVNWSWNPDGTTLVAQSLLSSGQSDEPARSDVKVFAADNGELLSTVASKAVVAVQSTRYSPDGAFMVVSQPRADEPDKGFELWVADRDGALKKKLTDIDGLVAYAWSPAGAKLAYIVRESSRNPSGPLRVLDVNTGENKLLSGAPTVGFFWSPDGARIAAFGPVDPRTISPDPNVINLLDERAQLPMLVQTIDVQSKVARELFYIQPSSRFMQFLLMFDQFASSVTIWSPNSRHLLVPISLSGQGGSGDLVIETEATGSISPRLVAEGSMATWSPK